MREQMLQYVPPREHPIRIPQNVPIQSCDPPIATAGEKSTWRLPFRVTEDVPADATLKLQLFASRNNRIAFSDPQVDRPGEDGYVTAALGDGSSLKVRPDTKSGTFVVTVPKEGVSRGSTLTVTIGDQRGGGSGINAPTDHTLNKFFLLYRPENANDILGTWKEEHGHWIVGACSMHVLGAEIDHLRAYVPSQSRPNQPIRVLVRPEDRFCNLSNEPLRELTVFLDERELPAHPEPVEHSTSVGLTVRLTNPGIHRLTVRDECTGKEALTNPTICSEGSPPYGVYWGMIHGHTEMSDGLGSLNHYFRQMRDEAALNFAATSDHDHLYETSDAMWESTCQGVGRWHEPGKFVTFLGYEWAKWRRNGDGDRNVYYLQDDRPMYRSDEGSYPTPPDLFAALRNEDAIVIPHHTAHTGNFCDWKDHDPHLERLVEIFQIRGSYECGEEEGNPLPAKDSGPPVPVGFVRRALEMGWRVGFAAGGDDHWGHAGTERPIPFRGTNYKGGLMCVLATERTRRRIWDALRNRRVVATSGPRMILTYTLNGHPMGSELDVRSCPELESRRELRVKFHGTAPVKLIEIIRNNEVVHSFSPEGMDCDLSWCDNTPLNDATIPPAKFCPHPFCFYYVRIQQTDGEMGWASPIWIDPTP